MSDDRRTVHARLHGTAGLVVEQIVRYDRGGRWYAENAEGKHRLSTVHEAATRALEIEDRGGVILLGMSGGGQFDSKVAGGRRRQGRGRG